MPSIRHRVCATAGTIFRAIFGFDHAWRDNRPATLSVGIARIAIFLAVGWVHLIVSDAMLNGDIAAYASERATGSYYPFGLLMLFGATPPGAGFWVAIQGISAIATLFAVIGFMTRPAMMISVLGTLLLVLFDASRFSGWSHPYNVIFLAAIPFMFAAAGQSFSVDRILYQKTGWAAFNPDGGRPDGGRPGDRQPVFWAVLAAQYAAALFYFGAFWAKAVISHGGIDYIFSDSMRHILALTWHGYVEMDTPDYIRMIAGSPILWMLIAAGHLFMQFIAVFTVLAVQKPVWRLIEGLAFALSCVGLYVFMTVFNPWWFLLLALFIDWDYFIPRIKARLIRSWGGTPHPAAVMQAQTGGASKNPAKKPVATIIMLTVFFAVYIGGFVTQKADELKLYPISDMNMYAAIYAMKPYGEHRPYIDILRGNIKLAMPKGSEITPSEKSRWIDIGNLTPKIRGDLLPDKSRKTTLADPVLYERHGNDIEFINIPDSFHLLAREQNLNHLKGSMIEFINWVGPLPGLPGGTKIILSQQSWAYSAYPDTFGEKKIYHSGLRAVMDLETRAFSAMSPGFDPKNRIISTNGVNITRPHTIKASFKVMETPTPLPYINVKGRWIDQNHFQIDAEFYEQHTGSYANILIYADTPMGSYDFDGPLQYWQ